MSCFYHAVGVHKRACRKDDEQFYQKNILRVNNRVMMSFEIRIGIPYVCIAEVFIVNKRLASYNSAI